MTNQLPIVYKRNTNGSINQWQIIVAGNTYFTIEGLLNGKTTQSKPTIVKGKNGGKKNQTSDSEQAYKDAERKFKYKIEEGYFEDVNKIDNQRKFFEPMLAHSYLEYKDKIMFPIFVEEKIDGARMIIQKSKLTTRNGKEYISCPHIYSAFKNFFEVHPNWVIDGEIYSHEVPFEKIMSLVRKTKPTKEDIEESEKIVQIYIFDGVVDDKDLGFEKRFKMIHQEIERLITKPLQKKYIKFVTPIEVNSHEEIEQHHNKFVSEGFEGVIIRIPDSAYENKRSKNLLKYKHFLDEEFPIIDVEEGFGNRSGTAGNLILKMTDGKKFSAGIRGGMEYYKYLFQNKSKIIGKLATIRYQNLTDEDKLPRFPVCVDIDRGDL